MIKKFIIKPLIFAVVIVLSVIFGVMIGQSDGEPVIHGKADVNTIEDVFSLIQNEYVDSVDIEKLQVDAVTSVLDKMDPHSEYIAAEVFDEINDPLLGSFEGIGVTFRIERDTITIINPVKGGPSEKVGIMAGDRIIYVEDSLVAGVKIQNHGAMKLLKGPKNTKVRVKVLRRDVSELLDFTIVRDVIPTYSIDASYMIDDNIGFIKLTKFSSTTSKEFVKAVKKLQKEGMTQLILDLRDNSGGYLSAAVELSEEILPKGSLIVYTEGEHRPRSYIFSRRSGLLQDSDVAVLIDEGSASASEILAGALQDNDRGLIVGRRSFGKGLVQEQFMLGGDAALRLTVARYYTPTGRCIQKPFDGDREKYLFEAYDRYTSGEMFNADSIHFADTQRFVTPGGRIVYGGGGIMPDVYVPLKTDSSEFYFNRIVNSGILFQYAFDYTDFHRKDLMKYENVDRFNKEFVFTDVIFNELMNRAAKKNIKGSKEEQEVARREAATLFKSYVARNIFGDESFYPVYAPMDEILQEALKQLREKN